MFLTILRTILRRYRLCSDYVQTMFRLFTDYVQTDYL